MNTAEILSLFQQPPYFHFIIESAEKKTKFCIFIDGLIGSAAAISASATFSEQNNSMLCILPGEAEARKFYSDVNGFVEKKKLIFFPSLWHKSPSGLKPETEHQVQRTEALNTLQKSRAPKMIITYPEALAEKVTEQNSLSKNTFTIRQGDELDVDFMLEFLAEYNFERTDFVFEPGNFSLRGGILDIFSYGHEKPVRIELNEDTVESVRLFDTENQLSRQKLDSITIIPNLESKSEENNRIPLSHYLPENTIVWVNEAGEIEERIAQHHQNIPDQPAEDPDTDYPRGNILIEAENAGELTANFSVVEYGLRPSGKAEQHFEANIAPQPLFNKNFRMLADNLKDNSKKGYQNLIFSDSPKQIERLYAIFEDIDRDAEFTPVYVPLSEGFIHHELKVACYSEPGIFSRFIQSTRKKGYSKEQSLTLRELTRLQPGDYVTHIDHGIGKYSGLEKIEVQGKQQEAVRLIYKDNDLLYVSIHSLHKISRYSGKDGKPPRLHKLGSDTWEKTKSRTRKKVKDIARDLIKLYAARKARKGNAFPPDNYLQTELEASFFYEDTPDQAKATEDIKKDMESPHPMDRLICGDVGFGKTEVAIRAAFKAVTDNKQVALLVPTTILTLQHYKTITERLKDFPCNVDYLSRFKSKQKQTETLKKLENGEIDIIIGTHSLLGKDVKFHNLGLLIIDEEQKFGVTAKEKIKGLKTTVDTLTLTATPIPRTLQFSLLGARDLSLIHTPPPDRQSIETVLDTFNQETITNAIKHEMSQGGQVFFVHNRIKDISQIAEYIRQAVPEARTIVAHGQMDSQELEEIMLNFVAGYYDVLVSTAIVESGLDIPNANTMIINQAQNFGLSDLYQLRGRVGRSGTQGYCYLLAPPFSTLPDDSRKRLKAIAEYTELGSGFHVAMRDMDIRGAGNMLGSEQSGFINEVGYDTYQKILKEAVQELKHEEFKDLFADEDLPPAGVDTQIDSDLDIMLPDDYVASVDERMALYHELNTIRKEEQLQRFAEKLTDRFGQLPQPAIRLLDTVRLRWEAEKFYIEKMALKNAKMKAWFAKGEEAESFYQSQAFGKLLAFVQNNPKNCRFREKNNRIVLTVSPVYNVDEALGFFRKVNREEQAEHS